MFGSNCTASIAILMVGLPFAASSAVTQVFSRAALNANDSIGWGQLPGPLAQLQSSFPVTSTNGAAAQVENTGAESSQQSTFWIGNFAPETPLIVADTILITFAQPVKAVGTQMGFDRCVNCSFTEHMVLYDSNQKQLGSFTAIGFETTANDNSAMFIGAVDDVAEIKSVQFFANNANGDNDAFAINQLSLVTGCPVNVTLSFGVPSPPYIKAMFVAPNSAPAAAPPTTLLAYAKACGFANFNWQQTVTTYPCPGPIAKTPSAVVAADFCPAPALAGSLKAPFADPPEGGFDYFTEPDAVTGLAYDPYPFLYPQDYIKADLANGVFCTLPGSCPPFPVIVSSDGATLSMLDDPADCSLPGVSPSAHPPAGTFMAFFTALVGVDNQGNVAPLYSWTWNSTYNGAVGPGGLGPKPNCPGNGGTSQTASFYPIIPGSGTGGVTITSINGVQLPTPILASQVATTASGLAYSRPNQTFNGTVTFKNLSSSAITGPLQIVFFGMPANVTLANATASLSGTPYITLPGGLAAGQSLSVNVQFKNPSGVLINSTPTVYTGSIQ